VSGHAPGRRSSRLRCPRLGSERCRGTGLVKPEFSTRPDQNSPVTNGTAAHTSASHPPRVAGRPEKHLGPGRGWRPVKSPRSGLASRRGPDRPHRRGKHQLSSSTGVGVEGIGEGEQANRGCQTAGSAKFRCPPPDSGVVPFSERPPSPIKSDNCLSGRVERSFGSIVMLPSSPVQPGGGTTF